VKYNICKVILTQMFTEALPVSRLAQKVLKA